MKILKPFDSGALLRLRSYERFRDRLAASDCRLCGLWRARTHIVVDRGNPGAKILLIGEAPGEREDAEAKAFVGRSGRLLDRLLQEAGLEPGRDVLIANVVKCRPPRNRVPTRGETETCLPYIIRQVELIRPRVIGLLGRTACRFLHAGGEGDKSHRLPLGERAGKFFSHPGFPGIRFFVLYHPAFILRNPRKRPEMLRMLRSLTGRRPVSSSGRPGTGTFFR